MISVLLCTTGKSLYILYTVQTIPDRLYPTVSRPESIRDCKLTIFFSTTACARDRNQPVITKPDGSHLTLTKGDSLSEWDIKQINMVYQCDQTPPTTTSPPTTVPPTTAEPEPEGISVKAGNMDLTGVSRDNRLWTFTPNTEKLDIENLQKSKIYLMAYFDNLTPEDIEKAKGAALLYFKYPMPDNDASCLLDRFEDHPLK